MTRCVIRFNALIARKKNYADQFVGPAMRDFASNADLCLHLKNNVQWDIKWSRVNSQTSIIFAIFVVCHQSWQASTPTMIIIVISVYANYAIRKCLMKDLP